MGQAGEKFGVLGISPRHISYIFKVCTYDVLLHFTKDETKICFTTFLILFYFYFISFFFFLLSLLKCMFNNHQYIDLFFKLSVQVDEINFF